MQATLHSARLGPKVGLSTACIPLHILLTSFWALRNSRGTRFVNIKANGMIMIILQIQSQFRSQAGGTAAVRTQLHPSLAQDQPWSQRKLSPLLPPPFPLPPPSPPLSLQLLKAEQSLVRDLYTVFLHVQFWCECRDVQRPPPRKLCSSHGAVWLSSVKGCSVGESWSVFVSVLVI